MSRLRFCLNVDRACVRVLRDLFSAKPCVLFHTTECPGGGIMDFDAATLLKFAAG
ncbi:hypothetical protein [Xanthobacter albus]|uniref:hypothetical protein n=1 Tax=Xanthobacter albus TaxID=3119929 RepID=UPI00372CF2F5